MLAFMIGQGLGVAVVCTGTAVVLGPVIFIGYCIGFILKAFMAYQIPLN